MTPFLQFLHMAENASFPYDYGEDYKDEPSLEAGASLQGAMHVVSMVIYSIAFVLGVTGNGLVIFIIGFRMKRTVNTIWFLNLAVADFIFTFFLPLGIAYVALGFHWPFGRALCKINTAVAFLNMFASVFLLTVISADHRCISVVCPVWAQNHRTPRLATLVALTVWVVALALCSPNIYFRHTAPSYHNKTIILPGGSTFAPLYLGTMGQRGTGTLAGYGGRVGRALSCSLGGHSRLPLGPPPSREGSGGVLESPTSPLS
uniref:G-protein coupled receptors family 1 profile domain-containing protein n=1 Tax=Pelusios castaneus TaxID=367368 RepID=A0A8C8SD04_9SAUR